MTDATPPKVSYSTDPALYIYTSLTAGSAHIVTATSRLETILRANRVPFKALDIATDEKARMLWGRRAGKDEGGRPRKLPALVQMGLIVGDLVEIEDWNEYGELKQHVTIYYDDFTIPSKSQAAVPNPLRPIGYSKPAASASTSTTPKPVPAAPPPPAKKENESPKSAEEPKKSVAGSAVASAALPIRSIAEEAAQKAKQVRLNSLREKVHGKKDKDADADAPKADESKDAGKDAEPAAAAATAVAVEDEDEKKQPETKSKGAIPAPLATSASIDSTGSGLTIASIGDKAVTAALQSPTSGAWKSSSQEDHLRQILQSPTSTTWKSGDFVTESSIREFHGSPIANASAEEIAAVEEAETIHEATSEEESED